MEIIDRIRNPLWSKKWICISLLLMFIGMIGASKIQTDFGEIQIEKLQIATDGGKSISAYLYRPSNVRSDSKLPIVIVCAGTYASKEQLGLVYTELPRRGVAVLTFDTYMHGLSSGGTEPYSRFAWQDAGMIALVEYVYHNLDYIDKGKISIMGHSLGGRVVSNTLIHYGLAYEDALAEAKLPNSDGGEAVTANEQAYAKAQNKVYAALGLGVVTTEISFGQKREGLNMSSHGIIGAPEGKKFPSMAYSNIAVCNGIYDEFYRGIYRSEGNIYPLTEHPDMLRLVNVPNGLNLTKLELNKFYGNAEDGTLRIIYNPPTYHSFVRFSSDSVKAIVHFFTKVFDLKTTVSPDSQVWFTKELFNALSFIGALLFMTPFAGLLINIPFFASIQKSIPEKLPALQGTRNKVVFWSIGLVNSFIAYWLLLPSSRLADAIWSVQTKQNVLTYSFPQKMTNFVLVWATLCALVTLAIFLLHYFTSAKKNGITAERMGLGFDIKEIGKNLLLALSVVGTLAVIVAIANFFFNLDFRFLPMAIKVLKPEHVYYVLFYAPLYFFFFFMVSLSTNGLFRMEGQPEWLNLLACGFLNVLGLAIAQISMVVEMTSTLSHSFGPISLNMMSTYHLLVLLFVLPYLCRYLFRLTGKVWLGAMITCLFIVLCSVPNTMLHVPVQ